MFQTSSGDNRQSSQSAQRVEEAIGILKDDKEFEEFEKESWSTSEEETADLYVWDDKWDCEVELDDEFTEYLRCELTKLGHIQNSTS
uniref:26S proteasome complex subunit SEM1 n=1 Tax=Trichobilharzia regenti TaxID=157069 RepID=A0AA85INN0_TRIRE|nr:unnamed protein product [Trichobilharzia regenti]